MKLLPIKDIAGPPADYLFARIRSRRARLGTKGPPSLMSSSRPHKRLQMEYLWVFGQMNQRLGRQLQPVFEYFELRSLVVALRYLMVNQRDAMLEQLQFSLLQTPLQESLRQAERAAPAIVALERQLQDDYPYAKGLAENYLRQGPGGVETQLLGGCLQQGLQSDVHAVYDFFQYLLDRRNLLAVYKHLRWQVPVAPQLLIGGRIPSKKLEKIWSRADRAALMTLIAQRAGVPGDPERDGVEDFLNQGLSRWLYRKGREPLQLGVVLDYLWRCQLSVRQRALQLRSTEAAFLEEGE